MRALVFRNAAPWAMLGMLCVATFWFGLGNLDITDLDEGLYTAAARNMAVTGDLITPRVGRQPFFEKPPLLYWLVALTLSLFGPHEFAARLPSALAATLSVALTYWYGRKAFGQRAALTGGAFLAVAPVFVGAARLATTDALLVLFVTAAIFSFYMATTKEAAWKWSSAAGVCCGLGVLTKGAPGLVLPLTTYCIWFLSRRSTRCETTRATPLTRVLLLSLFVAAVIAVPWHIAAWKANVDAFVREYVLRQHIQRFRGGDRSHRAPAWFFVPAFLIGFFPGSAFAVGGLFARSTGVSDLDQRDDSVGPAVQAPRLLLKTWFWVTFVLFSLGGSKLVSYILPLYPAAALIAGDWVAQRRPQKALSRPLVLGILTAMAVLLLLISALLYPQPVVDLVQRYADRPLVLDGHSRELLREAAALTAILIGSLAAFVLLLRLRGTDAAIGGLVGGSALFIVAAVLIAVPRVESESVGSLHRLARRAGHMVTSHGMLSIAIGSPRRPSVYFYLPETVLSEQRVQEVPVDDLESAQVPDGTLVLTRSTWRPSEQYGSYTPVLTEHDYALWRVERERVTD